MKRRPPVTVFAVIAAGILFAGCQAILGQRLSDAEALWCERDPRAVVEHGRNQGFPIVGDFTAQGVADEEVWSIILSEDGASRAVASAWKADAEHDFYLRACRAAAIGSP